MSHAVAHPAYDYRTIRHFAIMAVVWGIVGMAVGVLIAAQLVWPEPGIGMDPLRATASTSHQCCHLCLRRMCALCNLVLRGPANMPHHPSLPESGSLYVLGMEFGDCPCRHHPTAWNDNDARICRIGMAD